MRVLLFSDLHAHSFRQYSETLQDGTNSRLQDALNILNEISSLVAQYKVNVILFGGDLFHIKTPLVTVAFNKIYQAISNLSEQVGYAMGLLVGNHDQVDKEGKIHTLETLKSVTAVMDEPSWYEFEYEGESLHILALPYQKDKTETQKLIKHYTDLPMEDQCILLGHLALNGAKMGANFIPDKPDKLNIDDLRPEKFKQVFLGHYHIQQQVIGNVRYIGSTHHHNWGDLHQLRGVWIWDTPQNKNSAFQDPAFVPLTAAPKFMELNSETVMQSDPSEFKNNIVRIAYKEFPDEFNYNKHKSFLLENGARWVDLHYEPPEASKIDFKSKVKDATYQLGQDYEVMIKQYAKDHYQDKDNHYEFNLERLVDIGSKFYKQAIKRDINV